ncbi:hypothetical protein DSO57_1009804 [Entomophthora muscae]|uniref:Uncharacterized protein n=1 Tax=Entomophthora muscae TaxID=34485 RepID=A0ACC2RXV6_9FUNG|nr:hypothetical protein DSO57_1009804 [Entomophthora muscae]
MREFVYMDKRNGIPGVLTYGSSPSLEFFMVVFDPRRGQARLLPSFLKKKQEVLESFEKKCAKAGRLVLDGLVAALGINSSYTALITKLYSSHLELIKCGPKKSESARMGG